MSEDDDSKKTDAESQPQSVELIATPVRNTRNTHFDSAKKEQSIVESGKTPSVEVTACEPTTAPDPKIPEVANEGSKAVESTEPNTVEPRLAEQAANQDRKAMYRLYINALCSQT